MKLGIALLVGALVIFYVVTQPSQSADIASGAWDTIVNIADGIRKFVNELAN